MKRWIRRQFDHIGDWLMNLGLDPRTRRGKLALFVADLAYQRGQMIHDMYDGVHEAHVIEIPVPDNIWLAIDRDPDLERRIDAFWQYAKDHPEVGEMIWSDEELEIPHG
jgi:hypothetical protein